MATASTPAPSAVVLIARGTLRRRPAPVDLRPSLESRLLGLASRVERLPAIRSPEAYIVEVDEIRAELVRMAGEHRGIGEAARSLADHLT